MAYHASVNPDPPNDPWNAPVDPQPQYGTIPAPLPSPEARQVPFPRAYLARKILAWLAIGLSTALLAVLQYFAMKMLNADAAGTPGLMQPSMPMPDNPLVIILLNLAALALLATAVAGYVLLIIIFVMVMDKQLKPRIQAGPPTHRSAYLEAFALFLVCFIALQIMGGVITELTGFQTLPIVLALAIAPIFWPLVLGVRFAQFRKDMGWIAPRGILREIGVGVLGYAAGLPLIAGALIFTALLSHLTGIGSGHPIQDEVTDAGVGMVVMLVLMAVVWAPLVEEAIFRGALYRHLRSAPGWVNWLVATALSSFIFAAIHPQGIIGIPVLMTIAFVLAAMREMRESLIACVVAHALNNGLVMALLLIVLYG